MRFCLGETNRCNCPTFLRSGFDGLFLLQFSAWPDPERAAWAVTESWAALEGLWRTVNARWVNHPDANRAASSRSRQQLRRAARFGFSVPRTVVTNDAGILRQFGDEVGGDLVCKPVDEGRLNFRQGERLFFTTTFVLRKSDDLADLGPEPYLFQELVRKKCDVRVTVIGDEVFATRIESQRTRTGRVDWRASGTDAGHRVEPLPVCMAEKCLALTRSYGLAFGAIDLARVDDGLYTFFEINPNGQWAWIEQLTGQPLRQAMAGLLTAR